MTYKTKQLGFDGEAFVATHLEKQGYTIVARNYQRKFGEVDLIAQRADTLAFVEVKTRRNSLFDLTNLVNHTKQKKIINVAKEYMARNGICDKVCRFDVAIVEIKNGTQDLCYVENAFDCGD